MSRMREDGIPTNNAELIHQREEELRHAQDVRELYEQKLDHANQLYRELSSCRRHLDSKELKLHRYVHRVYNRAGFPFRTQ